MQETSTIDNHLFPGKKFLIHIVTTKIYFIANLKPEIYIIYICIGQFGCQLKFVVTNCSFPFVSFNQFILLFEMVERND